MVIGLIAILLVPVAFIAAIFGFVATHDRDQIDAVVRGLRRLADDMQAHADWIRGGRP